MDPWLNKKKDNELNKSELENNFEDNFQPTVSNFLPDSEKYLATLESKLNKIKSDPNVLRQLRERHQACIEQLLYQNCIGEVDQLTTEETLHLDTPIPESTILRTVLPQRQALTVGEVAELVKHDQLQTKHDHSESEDNTSR